MTGTTKLEPLPDAVIVADRLRRMAKELILEAETLEASSTDVGRVKKVGSGHVEYRFSAERRKNNK